MLLLISISALYPNSVWGYGDGYGANASKRSGCSVGDGDSVGSDSGETNGCSAISISSRGDGAYGVAEVLMVIADILLVEGQ